MGLSLETCYKDPLFFLWQSLKNLDVLLTQPTTVLRYTDFDQIRCASQRVKKKR